jgi:glutamate-1-semialdehyde 2,1-aminomutase
MGLVLPTPGFLQGLRDLCTQHGTLLVFDEVMTGCRVHPGGAQALYKIRPDLTTLGKVIGGGMPVGAYGGSADLMRLLAPEGPCYQAGTLSGNPVSVAAGIATLKEVLNPTLWRRHSAYLTTLVTGLGKIARRHEVPFQAAQVGTMWGFFFNEKPVTDLKSAMQSDLPAWTTFIRSMYQHGIYLAPSPYEAAFWSFAHGPAQIRATLAAAEEAFAAVKH